MRTQSERIRPFRALFAVAALLVALVPAAHAGASAENPAADEAQFVSLLNSTRAAHGLPPLEVDGELTGLARDWAAHQAEVGKISHASPISAGVTADWVKLGENVGTGGSVKPIMDAFIASAPHLANILDPKFTRVGVGVVWNGNALYTTHRFMALADAPTPEPAPEPAPAPVNAAPAYTAPAYTGPVNTQPAYTGPAAPPTTTAPPLPAFPPAATAGRTTALLTILHTAYA
jgi:hypothetical protein